MIERLVADDPTFAQRIVEAIRSAIGKFRGVKDPQLEQMKKAVKLFERALKKAGPVEGAKTSLKAMPDGTKYVRVDTDQDIFEGHDVGEYPSIAREYIKKRFRHTVIGEGNNRAFVDAKTGGEYTNPANRRMDQETFEGKMRASTELDNLVKASRFIENSGPQKRHPEFSGGFDLQDVVFEVSGKLFEGRLNIGIDDQGRRRLYDLTKIKSLDSGSWVKQHGGAAAQTSGQSSTDIISENVADINRNQENRDAKYSLPSRSALEAQILAWQKAHQTEIDAAKTNDGVSQFASKTIQNAPNVSDQIKAEFNTNPLLKTYRTDSNDAQVERALGNLKKNGFEKEAERLLNAETLTTDDGIEAGLMALYAFESAFPA